MKKLTEQRIFNITLFYLSRYESSSEKVRAMLKRRLKRMKMRGEEIPVEVENWIENAIQKAQKNSYLDDNRYAENQVRVMCQQGKSNRFIIGKLNQAGILETTVEHLLEENGVSELERAKHFAQKKHLGFYRDKNREEFYQKDMATLARAGFPYDIVKEVISAEE